ncbi:MAG: double-strand break repair protein AddB [Rhodospirillales bacterium]|nr:double-strand break repair protein AddB [Rhodospirillales bacterium]
MEVNPTVYTVPPSAPFADVLARGILDQFGEDPAALSQVVILLPTRRACRTLRDAFLRASGGKPLLLPRMTPLGDVDEDELALTAFDGLNAEADLEISPAISGLRRQLLLTRLVLALKKDQTTVDQAARLAGELARLLDQVHTEQLSYDALQGLVPEEYAEHWQITLEFLEILTKQWPEILKAEGCVDPAERRNLLLAAQAKRWQENPPQTPVIAAGSTGSIPATAGLLSTIARLPQGMVLLPGFDRFMDEEVLKALEPSHPQYGMSRLLETMQVAPNEVEVWPKDQNPTSRETLIAEALLPAATAGHWLEAEISESALKGVSRLDCPGPKEEAGIIALMMRETLEQVEEGRTAALVTPDRTLARRVAAELRRWGVEIDDSAGQPLSQSLQGTFLRLSVQLIAEGFAPLALLEVLKHPLAACGLEPSTLRRLARQFEIECLRGPRPGPGIESLQSLNQESEISGLLDYLESCSVEMTKLFSQEMCSLQTLAQAHVSFMEALSQGTDGLWSGEAGEGLASFMAELAEAAEGMPEIEPYAYPALLEAFLAGRAVRPRFGGHPRLTILGLLEARLIHADLLILGGLNEGTWPPESVASPWMSRPMMDKFGLPLPERRIGLTAHDFVQAFCAKEVVITRSERVEGTPTVPSRWLMRLESLLKGKEMAHLILGTLQWLYWQQLLKSPTERKLVGRPAPCPPVEARPRQLSVTQIETWMRDPYGVYARHILGLRALDPLDADPGAADYGTLIHGALEDFVVAYPQELPAKPLEKIIALGRERFGEALNKPGVWAFWWPRFEKVAAWFVEQEIKRRPHVATIKAEVNGKLVLQGPAGPFKLTAKADRIDQMSDGTYAIIDYKTGAPPTKKEVAAGFAPQLPLEAAMVQSGGFKGLKPAAVSSLEYWRLKGSDPVGEIRDAGGDTATLAKEAIEGLQGLVNAFDRLDTPYEARPNPEMAPKYSDYGHLARLKEWAAGEGDGE